MILPTDTIEYVYQSKGKLEEAVETFLRGIHLRWIHSEGKIFFSDGSFFDQYLAFSAKK